ncbi:MAG: hypothetical protein WC506_02160 [Candidatus Micrarchaeia archaeon]
MGLQIVVNNSTKGVANVRALFIDTKKGNNSRSIKPIDAIRHQNRGNIFNNGGGDYMMETATSTGVQKKNKGRVPKPGRITKIAQEHEVPAMYLHISRIKTFRVAECCESIASVLFAHAKTGDLSSVYKTWPQLRASAASMDTEAIFNYLASVNGNQGERVDLFTMAAAASVGKAISMAPKDGPLYGKTPDEWSVVVKDLAMRFAGAVEAEYVKIKAQKASEWQRMKQD